MNLKVFSALIAICLTAEAFATNYYVSTLGNDSNPGTSVNTAFETIQYVITSNLLAAGDTVFVVNGTYIGFDHRNPSGAPGDPIVYKALGNEVVISGPGGVRQDGINIENADHIVVDGFICNNMINGGNGIRVVNSEFSVVRNCITSDNDKRGIFTGFTDDIMIENNICSGSVDEHGIYVSNSSDRAVIRFNTCFGNNASGIQINADLSAGGDGISDDCQIYGNRIFENKRAAGINLDGVRNITLYNNIIYDNYSAQGIAFHQTDGAVPSTGGKIYNNTIIVPTDGRWGILFANGSGQGAIMYNNIILTKHSSRGSISTTTTAGMISDFNLFSDVMNAIDDDPGNATTLALWKSNTGLDQNSLVGNQLDNIFDDEPSKDFHLKLNSIALEKGTNLVNQIVTVDYDGNNRPINPLYDLGALERAIGDCSTILLPVHNPIFSNDFKRTITLSSDATITQNVSFKASESIQLKPSFQVAFNSIFTAEIAPCSQH